MDEYKHVCPVCEYVHEDDETVKFVPFDEMPADHVCPACGVEKDWFEKVPA